MYVLLAIWRWQFVINHTWEDDGRSINEDNGCKTKRQTLPISRVFSFLLFLLYLQYVSSATNKQTNKQSAHCHWQTPISVPNFFLYPVSIRFPRMIDCCCCWPNIPSYLFCIWQIHAHLAASCKCVTVSTRNAILVDMYCALPDTHILHIHIQKYMYIFLSVICEILYW